jgi:hypothetical protein
MDTYVEIDSAALGTRKNAARLLGFLDEKDELEDEGDYDKTEFRNESENENRKSLLSLHKKMFGALDDMINDCVELDQSSLKKNGRRLGLNGHGNGNDFAFDEDADLKKGIRLREYDAETLLQL